MADATVVWAQALDLVRAELNEPTFKTWFEHARPLDLNEGEFVIGMQSDFAREWFEARYSSLVQATLGEVLGRDMKVLVVVDTTGASAGNGELTSHEAPDEEKPAVAPSLEFSRQFNPSYTFDSFIVGESNIFAQQAALRVAEAPGLAFNPLFIYGSTGLGKTHLLHAIGNYVETNYPSKSVRYVTTERFTNDFIDLIRTSGTSQMEGFRRQYRNNDVLLIDDIQFLKGKVGTQEEFFYTFNTLTEAGKQVVLSSDRPPKDIDDLDERLLSRFMNGLIADVAPPNLETRIAILQRKTEGIEIDVPYEVLSFVAERVSSNIRELEGALTRIVAFASLSRRRSVDFELAKTVLHGVYPERSTRPISLETIQREVCKYFSVSHSELVGSKRSQSIVYPRQMAMYLTRELTELSLPNIGAEFGGRDHTTVIHAHKKIERLIKEQREVYNQIQSLTSTIRQKS